MEIKSVKAASLAKVMGVFYALMGLIQGVFVTFIAGFIGSVGAEANGATGLATSFGLLSIIILPVIYFVLGYIFGYIGAFLYNFIAQRTGGIILEVKK